MATKLLLPLLVAAMVVGVAWTFWSGPERGPAGRSELDALKAEVSALARRVESLAARPGTAESAPPAQSPDLEALRSEIRTLQQQVAALEREPGEEGRSLRSGPGESMLSQARLVERLDALLQREPESGDARRLADELAAKFRAALPEGASLRELRCRSSLCRAEMTYPDLAAYQQFVEANLRGDPAGAWPGLTYVVTGDPEREGGDVIALAYLARHERVFALPAAP